MGSLIDLVGDGTRKITRSNRTLPMTRFEIPVFKTSEGGIRGFAQVLNSLSLNGRTFDIISSVGRFAARPIGRELAMEKPIP